VVRGGGGAQVADVAASLRVRFHDDATDDTRSTRAARKSRRDSPQRARMRGGRRAAHTRRSRRGQWDSRESCRTISTDVGLHTIHDGHFGQDNRCARRVRRPCAAAQPLRAACLRARRARSQRRSPRGSAPRRASVTPAEDTHA
jgi:hypothetical protein